MVRVVAGVPLLGAGLTRAARNAGLRPVATESAAEITLRTPDQPPCVTPVDVCAAPRQLTVTFHRPIAAATWDALRSLVDQLLDT